MQEIRVGVVGLGFIGKQHVEALSRIPGIIVAAVADKNPESEEWCFQNGIKKFYQDYQIMIEEEKLCAIHDCTPNALHWDVNRIALENGCHVYSEKPLTMKSDDALKLCKLAQEKRLIGGVNLNYRNNAMIQEMRERVSNGSLGTITHIQVEYLQDWLLYDTDFDWRIMKNIGGVSRAVADIGSHCFDIIQYITSEKIVSVLATFHKQYEKRKRYNTNETFMSKDKSVPYEEVKVENEDSACILIELESGVKGSINISQICSGKKNDFKVLIGGTKEALEWNQEIPDRLWVGHRDEGNEILYAAKQYLTDYAKSFASLPNGHPIGWKDALTKGMEEFYKEIKNPSEKFRFASFEDGYYLTKIVEACVKSQEQEKWISVR
ncbi:Gfo/Idh/MocA family oxidoreductase [Blautia liquoris]|uniref:Gfo/Idh/MocA family oxidoreductase n=1 Tax=Blautia liquoris TaxID=2779518 RepID=A0A7M2RGW8_9FIRM|nr:Gfo/Idh/MocA family oxidoreductase [Blautia liquoris]QOV18787.1 Gfo/Idh/MocA family oxidoreductase [Blautia liquoris]